MDMVSDNSDGVGELPCSATAPVDGMTGMGLKHQMDSIFAEIEKSLPTINFDLSDVSSDSEEPVIFHRQLKVSELDDEDEKDLDTSLSGESSQDLFNCPPELIQIPSVDKNSIHISSSPTSTFDNDLAALLRAQEGFDDEEESVSSWKDLEKIARKDMLKKRESKKPKAESPVCDLSLSTSMGHVEREPLPLGNLQNNARASQQMSIAEAGNLILTQLEENNHSAGSSRYGGRTVDLSTEHARTKRNASTSTNFANESSHSSIENRIGDVDSNKEMERIAKNQELQEKKRLEDREKQRRKEKDLAMMYMSAKAPNLSTFILDSIDLDINLDSNNTASWNRMPCSESHCEEQPELSVPFTSAFPSADTGELPRNIFEERGENSTSASENLTLLQKLAKFALTQSGKSCDLSTIHPQTGAILTSSTSTAAGTTSKWRGPAENVTDKEPGSVNPLSDEAKHLQRASEQHSVSAAIASLLETLTKQKPEPETVYLDLRGFEQHQKEEQRNMASVSRVLGLKKQRLSQKEESSDSEDDDNWIQQRQQIKAALSSQPASISSSKQQPPKETHSLAYMINLHHKLPVRTTSSDASTFSCGVSASFGATGDAKMSLANVPSAGNDSNRQEEEAKWAREKKRAQQKELARIAHEENIKIQSARMRTFHHLQELRCTSAVSEMKPCAENTPVLFDLEASYEPRLPVLPTSLDSEEVLLLTVNLSSNGEIVLNNSRSSRCPTENEIAAFPKTYLCLICWLLSLLPHNFLKVRQWLQSPEEGIHHYPEDFPPFHVIGLQQLLFDGNLCLAIAVCPSPVYMLHKDGRRDRLLKKGKKGEETTKFFKFVDTFISRNSLSSVSIWPRYLCTVSASEEVPSEFEVPLSFSNSHLPFVSKPMSAFMQLHKDVNAVDKIFNKEIGVFWQTVDNQENTYQYILHDIGGENSHQNSMFLLFQQALFRPQVVHEAFFHVMSQSLDICGLRVLYPSSAKCFTLKNYLSSTSLSSPGAEPRDQTPVLAVAVRGPNARIRLTSIIGPMDYALAKRTDPTSLVAIYGTAQTGLEIFCPRSIDRASKELVRWFGGRVPEQGGLDVGVPYKLRDRDCSGSVAVCREKKGKKGIAAGGDVSDLTLDSRPVRPPAALTATTLGHIILVLSPFIPVWSFGFLINIMQQKAAFQPRGIRRLCLSVKKAITLGIPSAVQAVFCPGVNLDVVEIDTSSHQKESCSPCTVFILERENVAHHASSLARILESEMKAENIGEWIEPRTNFKFELPHLFHITDYTDSLLASLGGDFSKCPNFDPMCDMRGFVWPSPSNKELEQVVVLILLGKDLLKEWGCFLENLQSFGHSTMSDLELLGLKWLPGMNSFQTREVTPYEIGDLRWKSSVHFLANEPAVVLALRCVNAFKKMEPFVSLSINIAATSIPSSARSTQLVSFTTCHPTRLMSRNARESYIFLRLFFWMHELFPDPNCRTLLPCLPESRLYYDIQEWHELGNLEGSKPKARLKTLEELDLRQENIPNRLLCDCEPLTTFLLIKPQAVQKHLAKILHRIVQEGFSIVGLRLELMDENLVRQFLALEFEESVQVQGDHLRYLTSEPSLYLALSQQNAIKKLLDLLGPEDPQQARRRNQFYWQGIYGTDAVHNGFYASRTYIESLWDQKMFFPDGLCCSATSSLLMEQIPCPAVDSISDVNCNNTRHAVCRQAAPQDQQNGDNLATVQQQAHMLLMQTTCLVLPSSLIANKRESKDAPFVDIISLLLSRSFDLVGARMVWMSQPLAEQFLCFLNCSSCEIVSHLTQGPSLVLALQRDNAVVAFRSALGLSAEAQNVLNQYINSLFCPMDLKQARQLLALFFDGLMPGSHLDVQPLADPQQKPDKPAMQGLGHEIEKDIDADQ